MGVEDVLNVMVSGTIRVTANRAPFARVDAKERTIEVEISGIKTSGLTAVRLMSRKKKGVISLYQETEGFARSLSAKGWRLDLRDAGKDVVNMGYGVSGLMGPVHFHLFQIGKIRDVL